MPLELELIEEYELMGEKRYRFKIKDTKIVINVAAQNLEEAREKASKIIRDLKLEVLIEKLREK